ncbi:hypothetical protein J5N97_013600 [Dioscorea zingiberensis]|uniref:Uncharacterized protein n=1 Tax=Dioscorea zingiberensis TaxID=325984 RepID=A0A9D5CQV3_9LILI|nr:hypothetical protein J5N97_013600 [Dioscorea zingiberensis]
MRSKRDGSSQNDGSGRWKRDGGVGGLGSESEEDARETAKLEHEQQNHIRPLMKALECIPASARLWKAIMELANEEDARILL